ncbi:MAG: BlaI/MecI/CopY family transcriptional regulator [Acidobacteriota bacterium]|jgi:BlaI family penicillinase repressor|nr:BlaI/MecI/CopY family transcriptional regulator [Acidobacteriota bacterium]
MHDAMKISDAEWLVCRVLWRRSPLAAGEIIDQLTSETDWSPRTIKTLLNRLIKKNVLGFEVQGRGYLYFPLLDESECLHVHTQSFVERFFDGAAVTMLASFIEHQELSDGDIAELKAILEKKPK